LCASFKRVLHTHKKITEARQVKERDKPSVFVRNWFWFLCFDCVEEWCEDSPCLNELIRSNKVDLTSTEDIKDQTLIGIRQLNPLKINHWQPLPLQTSAQQKKLSTVWQTFLATKCFY